MANGICPHEYQVSGSYWSAEGEELRFEDRIFAESAEHAFEEFWRRHREKMNLYFRGIDPMT